jgi:hypothetical protein
MLRDLSPVVHQYDFNLYRVPLRKEGNSYTIYVGDNFNRVFDEHTLPDEVKTKMAMVLANAKQIVTDEKVTQLQLMMTTADNEFRDVGWRASDTWFCIILSLASLMKLRGED